MIEEQPSEQKTIDQVKESIISLYSIYESGNLPEPSEHEVNPGLDPSSRENYIYFTFPCALNYQRNSPALWASALATYEDQETVFLFEPAEVIGRSFEEVQGAMRKHKLALKTNKDPKAWIALSSTFANNYASDPRQLVVESGNSIVRMMEIVQREKKKDFPYIGGPKLSNYWAFILTRFTDVSFEDPYELSIIPDVHVIRASKKLGLVGDNAKPKDVDNAWRPILKELQIKPEDMHPALWLWSRSDFAGGVKGVEIDQDKFPVQRKLFDEEQ